MIRESLKIAISRSRIVGAFDHDNSKKEQYADVCGMHYLLQRGAVFLLDSMAPTFFSYCWIVQEKSVVCVCVDLMISKLPDDALRICVLEYWLRVLTLH